MPKGIRDYNDWYTMSDPVMVPLRFASKSFYRVAADMTCRKCGRRFVQVGRVPLMSDMNGHSSILVRREKLTDEQIVTCLMIKACEHGVGNPKLHEAGCPVGKVRRTGKMALGEMSR